MSYGIKQGDMSRLVGKTNNMVSEQVRHKPGCTGTEDGQRLEILDLESRGIVRAIQISAICVFVFAYADCWFSHEEAHMKMKTEHSCKKPNNLGF